MARYLGPKLRLSRREGDDLGHKSGIRPIEQKCKFKNKPGDPPKNLRMRHSDFLSHLRAKQKMRRYYNVLERQFRTYYRKAAKAKGDTGTNLLDMLERRLDNVVYRMGFARTRAEARQVVSHKQVLLDGRVVNIPSCQVGDGQIVSIRPKARAHGRITDAVTLSDRNATEWPWLDVDPASMAGKMVGPPDRTALGIYFDEGMVVEYYSK